VRATRRLFAVLSFYFMDYIENAVRCCNLLRKIYVPGCHFPGFPRLQELAHLYCSISQGIRGVHSGCSFPRDSTIRGVFSHVAGIKSSVLYGSNSYFYKARSGVSIRVAVSPEILRSGVSFPRLQECAHLYCSSNKYYNVARSGVSIRVAVSPEILRSGV